jgi:hypothetical protein
MRADDRAFVSAFERCELDAFRHRDHVRLAWAYLREHGRAEAARRTRDGIRRFAEHHGAATKYHETMTIAWLALVADALAASADEDDFERFLDANPRLLDAGALAEHYSPDRLRDDRARHEFVEPDLRPFGEGGAAD